MEVTTNLFPIMKTIFLSTHTLYDGSEAALWETTFTWDLPETRLHFTYEQFKPIAQLENTSSNYFLQKVITAIQADKDNFFGVFTRNHLPVLYTQLQDYWIIVCAGEYQPTRYKMILEGIFLLPQA